MNEPNLKAGIMNSDEIHHRNLEGILNSVRNAKRVYRDQGAEAILRQPELIPFLIEYLYSSDQKHSIKSAWVLELVCLFEIRLLLPYLSEFTSRLKTLEHESAIRPVSKVCSLISLHCKEHPCESFTHDSSWKNNIIEASFEWLTGQHKIAAQVFAMESLFILGQESNWILDELYSILDKHYPNKSSGYQSRARKIMDKISKVKRKKT
jgi:hypothetical protein